jgi:DNA invertase Pin-like site-specific DNA recombinase
VVPSSDGGRLLGYARVSTDDQDLSLQIDALEKHGVAKMAMCIETRTSFAYL